MENERGRYGTPFPSCKLLHSIWHGSPRLSLCCSVAVMCTREKRAQPALGRAKQARMASQPRRRQRYPRCVLTPIPARAEHTSELAPALEGETLGKRWHRLSPRRRAQRGRPLVCISSEISCIIFCTESSLNVHSERRGMQRPVRLAQWHKAGQSARMKCGQHGIPPLAGQSSGQCYLDTSNDHTCANSSRVDGSLPTR